MTVDWQPAREKDVGERMQEVCVYVFHFAQLASGLLDGRTTEAAAGGLRVDFSFIGKPFLTASDSTDAAVLHI